MAIKRNICSHLFTFTLMTTGAFSQNFSKLFSELKLVTDNLSLHSCRSQLRSHWRYISLPSCASKLARSSAHRSTNSLLVPWLHCPFMHKSCDKNVLMSLCGEMAGWKKTKPEASPARIFPPVRYRPCQRWDTCPVDLHLYWQKSPT